MNDDRRSADERQFEAFLVGLRRQGDRLRRVRTEEAAVMREAGPLLPRYDALVARNPGRFRMSPEDLETITYFSPADVDEARARADAHGAADPAGDDYDYEEMSDADLARAVIAGGVQVRGGGYPAAPPVPGNRGDQQCRHGPQAEV